jgi:hypothetical protein
VRESEEHDDNLAFEIRERASLAVVIRELELFPERRTGDIRQLELR